MFPDERHAGGIILRSVQLIELRILKILDHICSQNRIAYWLDGGTLLGAVRHQGFIPWDDDVDVVLPRADFDRFVKIAEQELPDDLELEYATSATDCNYNVPCRIRDKYSRIVDTHSPVHQERGVFIDILPIDDFHQGHPMLAMERLAKVVYRNLIRIYMPPAHGWLRPIATVLHRFLNLFAPVVTAETPVSAWRTFVRKHVIYSDFRKSGQGNPGYGFDVRWTRIFKREDIYPIGTILFENMEFHAPHNPDGVLRVFYGDDYMIPPPPSKRPPMHFSSIILDTRVDSPTALAVSDSGHDA
jgi:lipopolysaccharide cholinephosphotransferase